LREQALGWAGSPQPVPYGLVTTIAREIEVHCGHRRLKCRRLAMGWTVAQAVKATHDLITTHGLPKVGLSERSWKDWEAGGSPIPEYQDLLCRLFTTGPVQLGFASDYTPAADRTIYALPLPAEPSWGDATNRRAALKILTASAADALAPSAADALHLTQDLERTDLGSGTLEHLHEQIEMFAADYAAAPAASVWPQVRALRQQAATLLASRHTLAQDRSLTHAAGTLSAILAWLAHDLGDSHAALAYCTDARAHGLTADALDVCAWADDAAATIALYGNQPERAVRYATRGLAAAPAGPARVRLAAQAARAHARIGDEDAHTEARTTAYTAARALPVHARGLFSADQIRLVGFDATSYLALGQPQQALSAAQDAVAQYDTATDRSPTRAAIAHLDLAAAHAALSHWDDATVHGSIALHSVRTADAITARAHNLACSVLRQQPTTPAAHVFAQRLCSDLPRSQPGSPAARYVPSRISRRRG
jgi:hypothetical protein